MRIHTIQLITANLLLSTLAVLSADAPVSTSKPIRVLFIGNSLTTVNNLPRVLTALAEHTTPPTAFDAVTVATGGFTLEKHWLGEKAQKKIQEGGWDYVVLQDNSSSPKLKSDSMKTYARLFDAEIKKANAKGLLYMTWALQKTPDDQAIISAAYEDLGKELNEKVVPVGLARVNAFKGDATVNLYVKDGKHPTPAATYLAACTFYASITGHSSKSSTTKVTDAKDPKKVLVDISAEQAAYFQKIADETVGLRN
ncbi:MAG: DUF4886 domain-containing protein [Planctomycetota bacterium]